MFAPSSKILIVDDFVSMRAMMKKCLVELKFTNIDEAKNGAEAYQMISAPGVRYDLILSDWKMPESDGIDLLKRLKTSADHLKTIPFILVTTQNEKESILEAVSLGVSGYVVKPFQTSTIEEKLKAVYAKMASSK